MILARIGKTNGEQKQVIVILELIKRMQLYNKGRIFILFCDMHKLEILQHIVPL